MPKKKKLNVVWADISDSTGTTQFRVLPYVNIYIKSQLLINKGQYQNAHYAMRIYGDFYNKRFAIEDEIPMEDHLNYPCPEAEFGKIKLGWNSGLAIYSCLGLYYSLINYKYFNLNLPLFYLLKWKSPYAKKNIPISCRIGSNYKRNTIRYQREKVKELLSRRRISTSKLTRLKYFCELKQSLVCVSPFGLGEISLRDFEIIVSGGLIMKADCSHMETFPDPFIKDKSYLDYSWDLSDFDEKLDYALSHPAEMRDRANYAQQYYKNLLTTERGAMDFCQHFYRLL